jgi:hypothetical protein
MFPAQHFEEPYDTGHDIVGLFFTEYWTLYLYRDMNITVATAAAVHEAMIPTNIYKFQRWLRQVSPRYKETSD